MTFPKLFLENFGVTFCPKLLNMLLQQTCYQELAPLKILEKIFFLFVNDFQSGILGSRLWQVHFLEQFHFSFLLIITLIYHHCYSNHFSQKQRMWISGKMANISKYLLIALSLYYIGLYMFQILLPTHIWFSKYRRWLKETPCSNGALHNSGYIALTYNYSVIISKAKITPPAD